MVLKFQSTYPHGVRHEFCSGDRKVYHFNPRTRTGYDTGLSGSVATNTLFQSTYPHGVRHTQGCCNSRHTRFQSTYPHGVRPATNSLVYNALPFQSTYPHGVRPGLSGSVATNTLFQSTYPHGVRHQSGCGRDRAPGISIHVPARGTTLNPLAPYFFLIISIHVPARGTTLKPVPHFTR